MENRIRQILSDSLSEFYPDFVKASYSVEDDLSKIFPFSSFEWMLVIYKIEDELGILVNEEFVNKRSLAALLNK